MTASGVSQVKTTRDQEKKDMQDLNDRLSGYINKVSNTRLNNLFIVLIKRKKHMNLIESNVSQ